MIGRRRCNCLAPGPCFCAGTALGIQVSFADWADTFVTGLAAEANGTHVITPLTSWTSGYPYYGGACYGATLTETETMDIEFGDYGSFCVENCTGTSAITGNYFRVFALIGSEADPQTQIDLEVYLSVHGYLSTNPPGLTSCTADNYADVWKFAGSLAIDNCSSILESLTLVEKGRALAPSDFSIVMPWNWSLASPSAPCSDYQLDDSSVTCELSIVT